MRHRHSWLLATALVANLATAAGAADLQRQTIAGRINSLLEDHPQTFELTLMSHFSDDDFGFHVQTVALPRGDYLYPRYKISADQATAIVRQLAKTGFETHAQRRARNERFRPQKSDPIQRVYSLTIRCGDRAFSETVPSEAEMSKRADAIWNAFKGSPVGQQFNSAFRARIGQ